MNIIKTDITALKNTIEKILKLKKGDFLPDKNLGSNIDELVYSSSNFQKEAESYILSALNPIKGLKINSIYYQAENMSAFINGEYFGTYFEKEVNLNE